jgi:hypothetical protein
MTQQDEAREDPRLVRISAICAELPETTGKLTGRHAAFRVRNRTYACFLADHHATASSV